MQYQDLKEYINSGKLDENLKSIICSEDVIDERKRYVSLLDETCAKYGVDGDWHFISSPGRSEIGGNHTDHQHGHVLACALNIDNVACVKETSDNIVRFKDHNFDEIIVDLNDLSIHQDEINTSNALIRGIAFRFKELGYKIGGFKAICDSRVLIGSGISSSACFEVMVTEIFNALYNNEKVSPVERAIISQYAENKYFGKPCGLMDQMAISVGGFTAIDFFDPNNPTIENASFSFSDYGYELALVNTKGDHADLSDEYAAVPNEIKDVAKEMGVSVLADKEPDYFYSHLKEIRDTIKNDRSILRSHHFYQEDRRAILEKEAILNKDINEMLKLMKESGRSSYMYLQNVYPASRPSSQSLAIGLALAEMVIKEDGAYRVHGGGFDGTIQVVVKQNKIDAFKKVIEDIFGDDAILFVRVRESGTKKVI